MNLTVLKMLFTKQKHDNLEFKEALNRELMK